MATGKKSKVMSERQKAYARKSLKPAAKRKLSAARPKTSRSTARTSAKLATKPKLDPSKHKVMVRHLKDAKWEVGLRGHMTYRDTGISYATNGEFGAYVMKPREPGIPIAHPHKHTHATGFQMVYILDGWGRFWFDGLGEVRVEKGDCFYQPDGLLHQALEISDDLELLEITMPAEFETTTP